MEAARKAPRLLLRMPQDAFQYETCRQDLFRGRMRPENGTIEDLAACQDKLLVVRISPSFSTSCGRIRLPGWFQQPVEPVQELLWALALSF